MSITVNYEYKLKPNKAQIKTFDSWLSTCKKVYNYALRERKDWVNSRKSPVNACSLVSEYILPADTPRPTYYSQCKSLTSAKKNIAELTAAAYPRFAADIAPTRSSVCIDVGTGTRLS